MLDHATLARMLHVLGVVLWIGGVAFVTTVLLPSAGRMQSPEERVLVVDARHGAGVGGLHRIERMHWVLLAISLVTVLGAVAGSHGWLS